MSKASKEALETLPENTTECPFIPLFSGNKRKHEGGADDGNSSFFWGEDAKRAKTTDTPKNGYVCKRCNVPGHYIKDCPTSDYVCRKCNVPGHNIKDCPENSPSDHIPPEGYVCNVCKQPGHYIKNCPERQASAPRGDQPKCKWFICYFSDLFTHQETHILFYY
jgi:hypothetical protein